jgi:hypothetical protein
MTQPPGPQGPYPHYPQGQPPSGGFPQQPYPQQGGWPQQQGWPGQPGGWQQQPGGWPDQQQHPYGQPGQFPGDDPFADEDDKKKSKLPWILGGLGALVVIGGVIVLILVLGSGASKGGTAQETAEAFATAFNDRDADGLKALLCEANLQGETGKALDSGEAFANAPDNIDIELTKVEQAGDDTATAHYKQVEEGKQHDGTIEVPLVKNGDVWEVCIEEETAGSGES